MCPSAIAFSDIFSLLPATAFRSLFNIFSLYPPAHGTAIFSSHSAVRPQTGIDQHLYLAFLFHRDYFAPVRCIPILLFLLHRDYFARPDASLSCSFAPQGLLRPTECISVFLFFTTWITLPRSDASLSCFSVPQGLFRSAGCISIFLFFTTRIISPGQMHPSPALFHHRDYFGRSDKSHR